MSNPENKSAPTHGVDLAEWFVTLSKGMPKREFQQLLTKDISTADLRDLLDDRERCPSCRQDSDPDFVCADAWHFERKKGKPTLEHELARQAFVIAGNGLHATSGGFTSSFSIAKFEEAFKRVLIEWPAEGAARPLEPSIIERVLPILKVFASGNPIYRVGISPDPIDTLGVHALIRELEGSKSERKR
jgi:hypothetical protein